MNSDDDKSNDFGPRFGRLIRSYRDDLGLSARELAIRVWNDEGRKATVSRLENGRVAQPAAKTVQAIALALDIPQEEIDALRQPTFTDVTALAPHLESISRASRDLLEALAARFEVERAFSYTDAELRDLLELKAEEYRRYHKNGDPEGDTVHRIGFLKSTAEEAAQKLDFAGAEKALKDAEQRLLVLSAEIKEARARNALLRSRLDQAFEMFESAAEIFRQSDLREMARRRNEYHNELAQRGLRFGDEGFEKAIEIQRPAIDALEATEWRDDWADYLKNLANSLALLGDRTGGEEGRGRIEAALAAYRRVAEHFTRDSNPLKWATTQQNIGGASYLLHLHSEGAEQKHTHLEAAIKAYRQALRVRDRATYPYDWAVTMQNLGVALMDLGTMTGDGEGRDLIGQAIAVFTDALGVRTREDHPFEWAMTCENLARAEWALSNSESGAPKAAHVDAAIAHVESVIEVYRRENAPFYQEKATKFRDSILNDPGHSAI